MLFIFLYYLLFFVLYWMNRNDDFYNSRVLKYQCFIAFILLFVFFGFRDLTVLNDTVHYYVPLRRKIAHADKLSWLAYSPLDRFEYGYQIFENILAKLFNNPYVVIVTSSLIITVGNICFFKKHNLLGLLLCLFFMLNFQLENQYSAIRQGFATVIFYFAFNKYLEKKYLLYIFYVVLASFFHITAITLLLLLPLAKIRFTKKTIFMYVILFLVFSRFLLVPVVNFFSTDSLYRITNMSRQSFPLASLLFALMNSWILYLSIRTNERYSLLEFNNVYWVISISCVFVSFMDVVFPIIGRINMYLFPIMVSMFVMILTSIPNIDYRDHLTFCVGAVFFVVFVLYNWLRPEWYHLYPYSFMDMDTVFKGVELRRN